MSKHLKRCAALVLSLAMAIQFGTSDYFAYAETTQPETGTETETTGEPVTEEDTTPPEPEVKEEPQEQLVVETPQAPEVTETPTTTAPTTPAQTAPVETAGEAAGVLSVEFVDESGNTLKSVDPITLTGKYVGNTFRLSEYQIDINVEGYTLVEVKDMNTSQIYNKDTVTQSDIKLSKAQTKIRFTYKKNAEPVREEGQTQQQPSDNSTEEEQDSEESDEADTDESEESSENSIENKNEVLSSTARVDGTVTYEVGENVKPFTVECNDNHIFGHSWSSSNTQIAAVTNRKESGSWGIQYVKSEQTVTVDTKKAGKAEIKCGRNTILTVIVEEPEIPASSLKLNKTNIDLKVGQSETVVATVYPENATVRWESRDTNVATVNSNGKITAKGIGTTTIMASSGDLLESVTVTVSRNTDYDRKQTAYFYFVYPGVINPGTGDDFKPGEWLYAGSGEVMLPDSKVTEQGTIYTGDLGIISGPTYFYDKTITIDGVKYRYDAEGTGAYGTFSVVWDKAILSAGANNSHKWDGEDGINESFEDENCWHIDGHLILNDEYKVTINFNIKNPNTSGYVTVNGPNAQDQYPQLINRGTLLNQIHQPSESAVPNTKELNGVSYQFDGWYSDKNCTQKVDFSSSDPVNKNTEWYGRYVADLTFKVNEINKTYDGDISRLTINGNMPDGYKKQYQTATGEWKDISEAEYKDVTEKTVKVRVIDASNKVVWNATTSVNIDPIPITLTSEDGSKEYDGEPLTLPNVTIDGEFAKGEGFVENPKATGSVVNAGDRKKIQ